MTHTYKISGMTCGSCEATIKSSLLTVPGITAVEISGKEASAIISMEKHISLSVLQHALGNRYNISAPAHHEMAELAKSWFATYRPVLLLFGYITVVSLITSFKNGAFYFTAAMNTFMAGFFLSFSFFKMLDLRGFADSYTMYDIIAKRIRWWAYIYPFVELLLGIAYAIHFDPVLTNSIAFIVMSISIIGVLQSLFNKRVIQCACLGAVFNLPMSTVTIIEDALMIVMSGIMLLLQHN
ncbi:MAG: cation transporter [Ferruginibacter sp.]